VGHYANHVSDFLNAVQQIVAFAWPGLLVVALASVLLAYPLGRLMGSNPLVVGLLLASIGSVLVFTLSPRTGGGVPPGCTLTITRPTRSELLYPSDVSLNLFMLVPLGVFIAWLRPWIAPLFFVLVAMALPFAVEYIQYAVPELGRACSLYDVATNLVGLFAGICAGLLIRGVWILFTPRKQVNKYAG